MSQTPFERFSIHTKLGELEAELSEPLAAQVRALIQEYDRTGDEDAAHREYLHLLPDISKEASGMARDLREALDVARDLRR